VTTNHYYTWAGGSYPATSTDTDFSDVVFDNSDDKTRQLNNIYLFYYPWYTSTTGNLTDYITINNTTGQDVNVFIVKQKGDAATREKEEAYRVKVNIVETMSEGKSTASTKLRTNFNEDISYEGDGVRSLSTSNAILALNGNTWNADKISSNALLAEGTEQRLFDVTVTAYSSGAYGIMFDEEKFDEKKNKNL
jgi:hypothetical protein